MLTLDALQSGGKPALARALSLIERRPDDPGTIALLDAAWAAPKGPAIGITGPPGVGKSSLIDALIRAARGRRLSIGVIAVDPSSRRTGGALLGDRTRITSDPEDEGVFIRSMAARDQLGGLAALTFPAATLMRAAKDVVVVETVGVGQSETTVADLVDLSVFCAQPGAGDALQYMKAGVMEIPDLLLVTKSDLGASARRAAADAAGALSLSADRYGARGSPPPVALVSAATGDGVDDALEQMLALAGAAQSAPGAGQAQASRWIMDGLLDEFGRRGLAALGLTYGSEIASEKPFAQFYKLRTALAETWRSA